MAEQRKNYLSCVLSNISVIVQITILGPVFFQSARAEDSVDSPASVEIVFDASGSMWGQIDGTAKIDIARGVINDFVKTLDPKLRVGLMVYGHRRKGDCADIEELVPAAAGAGRQISEAIATISPKGKTPLTDAVRQAAQSLRYREEPATVILVTDGLETCNADPCALSAELEKDGVDFTAHVVGFDVSKEETATLQCIAANTGGKFLTASSATELRDALTDVGEAVAEGVPNVLLTAKAREDGEILADGVSWEIYRLDDSGERKYVAAYPYAKGRFTLEPGRYVAVGVRGSAKGEALLVVEKGKPLEQTIIVGSGEIKVSATARDGGEIITDDLSWEVYKVAPEGGKKYIEGYPYATHTFALGVGPHVMRAIWGFAAGEEQVDIRPDETIEKVVVMNAGTVSVSAKDADGKEFKNRVSWEVYRVNADGKRKYIGAYPYPATTFHMNAGSYVLIAGDGVSHKEFAVEIHPGDVLEKSATFGD